MKKHLLEFIILFLPVFTLAQVNVQNTGVLYSTGSSDIIYVAGSFGNSSTASLTNNGSLYVVQDLANDQIFSSIGNGTLYLNGTLAQAVSGSQAFKTYNLVTNNTAGITLNNNLSVANSHTYTNGLITTSATPNYLIYEAGSSYSGDNDSRHVNGWVKKFGNTTFIFPVGDASYERTIRLSALSASSEFNIRYARSTPYTTSIQSPLVTLDAAEYWMTNKVSGGTAVVTLNWDNSKVPFPTWVLPMIAVGGYNGSLWTDQGGAGTATGNVTTTGTVVSSAISSFNFLTFASKAYPIPLRLISFTAEKENGFVDLNWVTENEVSVSHFVVEKSADGRNFQPVMSIPARNTGMHEMYNTTDSAALPEMVQYRLKSIDVDGKFSYSNIVIIRRSVQEPKVYLVSNPVHDQITLAFEQPRPAIWQVTITSANGQLLGSQSLQTGSNGNYRLPVNANWSPGVYFLTLVSNEQVHTFRLVKN